MDQHKAQNTTYKKFSWRATGILLGLIVLSLFLIFNFFIRGHHPRYTKQAIRLPHLKSFRNAKSPHKDGEWIKVTAQNRDTLGKIFKRQSISSKTLLAVMNDNRYAKQLTAIKPNQEFQFLIKKQILEELKTTLNPIEILHVKRQGDKYKTTIEKRHMDVQTLYVSATVKGSLYQTAKRMNIPYKVMQQMTEILTWEIDFGREVRPGDQFTIMYEGRYIDDQLVSTGDILAVSYTNKTGKHQAIKHQLSQGSSEYFNAQGKSFKKAFTRYPLRFSHISSTFSTSRYHPILRYRRAHKGIDLAARLGTPILASGDGQIVVLERNYGYGNMIKINHGRGYATVYGHMLKFQKGLSRGSHVKRGQVIGFVGQTGLATGPHLHYEFHINGVPRNPTTVKIPLAEPLSRQEHARFNAHARKMLAQLELFENAQLASNHKLDELA